MLLSGLDLAWSSIAASVLVVGLAGCPTVDLGDTPPDPGQCRPDRGYFEDVIWPSYIAPDDAALSCVDAAGCHRDSDGRSGFRVRVPRAGEAVDFSSNYDSVVFFLNCSDPGASRMLTKPQSGLVDHAGGDIFAGNSASAEAFLDWFAQ
ncbi:hypothetical protein [Haliangium ochraceum]|uniref:hypothetical protein n=1 Tax=Haliangium ochraceum TaxID=80816 RepID=UPI0005D46A39|nr:hypothetical protein [Haliangium ochraceum]